MHAKWRMPGGAVVAFSLLAGKWYLMYGGRPSAPSAPLWSISLEEQFYLIWPTLAKCGGAFPETEGALYVCTFENHLVLN